MPAAERPSARVLIVDRDLREARLLHAALDGIAEHPTVVRALGLRLKAAGYEVLVATDGIRATQIAIREQPSLILLDIGMPGGDGHTVAQRLKNNLRTVSIPVIFLTARNSPEDARKAAAEGAVAYLTKPCKPEDLLAAGARALNPLEAAG